VSDIPETKTPGPETDAGIDSQTALAEQKPEAAEAKPEATEAKPEVAEQKPEVTEAKPEATEAKPEVAEQKPEVTEAKPEATEAKPEVAEEKPEAAEAKTEAAEVKPEAAVVKTQAAEPKPEAVKEKPKPPVVIKSAGVTFIDGKVLEFNCNRLDLHVGDTVVVDNQRDLNLGKVVFLADNQSGESLRKVIRRISPEDMMLIRRNKKREEEGYQLCVKLIKDHKLQMKLIRVAYLHGGNKAIFYFSAEGRVDFRGLVRDLAQQLHVRIEMRQIGVRDESKMWGGIGICGQHLCCSRFLHKFVPVSIKMAKNQNLALNPQKLSGLCGRLMCCLVFEDQVYRDLRKLLPKIGTSIESPGGPGKVIDVDVPGSRVRVQLQDRIVYYTLGELSGEKPPVKKQSDEEEPRREGRRPRQEQRREGRKPKEERKKTRSRDSRGRRRRKPRPAQAAQKSSGQTQATQGKPAQAGQAAKPGEKDEGADKKKRTRRRRSRRRSRRKKGGRSGTEASAKPNSTEKKPDPKNN
jgi:cell fate regulator YaaT (PSP1 superfamily)